MHSSEVDMHSAKYIFAEMFLIYTRNNRQFHMKLQQLTLTCLDDIFLLN